ncbi:carbon monoxide-induced hydrogenase, large subunit [Citrifermentans bemidjiense Bem]|uniref:Carbon monoxide-induced hydrogenase, large subunit n=1 Tax=Citrifermentans bemidjiense (strain ATCC BAA-1014 / DSM 16622 / JCM 12645 / Bem) TaxID=404380 RepID=B5E8B7_CITBB|nr:nickel-dependent hydrogenase large subunit [Citrifermentans bemidjiense]ACH37100.1 carbon monoxide-induced hydrogenase, large subunit [Citrifermentans bemidjiense Bem]
MSSVIELGPHQLALEEPMYFRVKLEGDRVAGLDVQPGQVHRGMEHLVMRRNLYQNITLLERLCSLCSNSHPSTFCSAIEEVAGVAIPERAEYLRAVADEIKRIASHLFCCAVQANLIGQTALFRRAMEVREIMQRSKEAIYGNRMDLAANCIGGVRYDLTPDAAMYLARQMEAMKAPLDELYLQFQNNPAIMARTAGVGVLPRLEAIECAVVGPVARACGIDYDVRKKSPYGAYDRLEFSTSLQQAGDVRARNLVRLAEARQSVSLIEQCLAGLVPGPLCADLLPEIPAGEAVAKSEAPRGELVYYLRTDGTDFPLRLKWRVPSYMNWDALKVMLHGEPVANIPLIVNSIDPCIACTDR